jgi:hypothetical protein
MSTDEILVTCGENKTLSLSVLKPDPADPNNTVPQSLTGCTLYFAVKGLPTDTTYLIYKTSASSAQIAITDATNGLASIYLLPSDTFALCPKTFPVTYYYDAWVKFADNTQKSCIRSARLLVGPRIYTGSYP